MQMNNNMTSTFIGTKLIIELLSKEYTKNNHTDRTQDSDLLHVFIVQVPLNDKSTSHHKEMGPEYWKFKKCCWLNTFKILHIYIEKAYPKWQETPEQNYLSQTLTPQKTLEIESLIFENHIVDIRGWQ